MAAAKMWPLAVLLLGSACCGSAQLIFNITRSVEYTACNETVIIPCYVNNVEATDINEMYVKWKFRGKDIFTFNGAEEKITRDNKFKSTKIIPQKLLNGIASLEMIKEEAVVGNYTCEVTELSREGETIIELKYRIGHFGGLQLLAVTGEAAVNNHVQVSMWTWSSFFWVNAQKYNYWVVFSWFSPNENILIVIFPILAVLLSWGQFGIVTHKYKSSLMKEKTILLFVGGLVLTIAVIVGAILFVPGEYSTKNSCGLGLIVVPTVILILLQYCVFMIGVWMSSFTIAILILQVLGYVLSVVGLSLCVSECTPVNGPLLISGLGIIALAELLGLVYMKLVASNQKTIQPPRKAVEEPLNAFKESKGMMNDE